MAYQVQQNLALKSSFSEILINMIENGFQQTFIAWSKRYMTSVWKPVMETEDSRARKIKLSHLSWVFYLYAIGMTATIAAFVLEVWWSAR